MIAEPGCHQELSEKLRPKASPSFKPPRVNVRAKCSVKHVNWALLRLYSIAQFLHNFSSEGTPCTVIEKVLEIEAIYVIETTLHVHSLNLRKRDKINLIPLATHLGLVDEVRIHNFQINHYTRLGGHTCILSKHLGGLCCLTWQ